MSYRWLICVAFAFALLGAPACTTTHGPFDYAAEPDPRKTEYILGPSDVLRINVWRNPELSCDATVRPDGTISVPLVGDLVAAGRTPTQIRSDLAQRMMTFIKEDAAIVTVAVTAINSYRFVVSGNVERPGAFASSHYVTVIEALALAGGPNRFASPEATVIIRAVPSPGTGVRRIPIDYTAILSGTHPVENLPVISGDTIYVP